MAEATKPDANGWIAGMDSADKDDECFVLVPDEANESFVHSVAQWDPKEKRWVGEWRYFCADDGEPLPVSTADPTHYKLCDLPVAYEASAAAA